MEVRGFEVVKKGEDWMWLTEQHGGREDANVSLEAWVPSDGSGRKLQWTLTRPEGGARGDGGR